MSERKILFIDRDGTLIKEPTDEQVDSIEKLTFLESVIPALLKFKQAGYHFVMITNQDGLGTKSFPEKDFWPAHELMLKVFESQGIVFESVRICPHFPTDNCECRKPKVGLLLDYLRSQRIDTENSYVIGDRASDGELATNLGIGGVLIDSATGWDSVVEKILTKPRTAEIKRTTNEVSMTINVNLDSDRKSQINTGIGFFDHMLEQIASHGGFELIVVVNGDLKVDDHHTVEDTAIALGSALKKALGDKLGIARFGFVLPMDESLAQVSIDLCNRAYCTFNGVFTREKVGELSTELVPHFFRSFADSLGATINISVTGENNHHMIEACFKGMGRCLRQAIKKVDVKLPTTKGVL